MYFKSNTHDVSLFNKKKPEILVSRQYLTFEINDCASVCISLSLTGINIDNLRYIHKKITTVLMGPGLASMSVINLVYGLFENLSLQGKWKA